MLASVASYETGGRGTGSPHLPSQGSVVAADGRLLAANAGSDCACHALKQPPQANGGETNAGQPAASLALAGGAGAQAKR